MGVEVDGVEELIYALKRGGDKARSATVAQLRAEAYRMRDLARAQAPVDEGDLERSIVVTEEGGGRGLGGRFAAKIFNVEVDGNEFAGYDRDGNPRTVSAYAWIMHEELKPFGFGGYNLGKGSRAKQAGQTEMVGGKFLERAVAAISEGLVGRLTVTAKEAADDDWY